MPFRQYNDHFSNMVSPLVGDAGDRAVASGGPRQSRYPVRTPVVSGGSRFTHVLLRVPDRWMIAIGRSASLPRTEGCKRRRSSNADARRQRTGDEDGTGDPDG